MKDEIKKSYEDMLDPKVLRPRIIECSLFIAIFESTKDNIISRLRYFYANDFDDNGANISLGYQTSVLSRSKSPIHASLDWLKENKAIEQSDIDTFGRIKSLRNDLAHGLLRILSASAQPQNLKERFAELIDLSHKIEHWWIKNVEIPTNPDFDGEEVKDEDITTGTTLLVRLLMDIALGDEVSSNFYIEQWRKEIKNRQI
jgi:hypothetical protein